jgi:hypothetical protein
MRQTILDISDAKEIFNRILTHWGSVNQTLSDQGLVLKGAFDRTSYLNAAVEFEHLGEIIDKATLQKTRTSENLILYKTNMRATMQRLGFLVRGLYAESDFARYLPALPDARSNEEIFMASVERTLVTWKNINAVQPLVMPDGTTLDAFLIGFNVLRQAFRAREKAFAQERYARAMRRQHHQMLVDRSVQYRQVILGTFGEDSPEAITLPYLWPKQDRTKKRTLKVVTPDPISSEFKDAPARLA